MSKTRCASTVPTSVAHSPFRRGSLRMRTATRASSPMRPGRTAFANSPTENAEKTVSGFGCGGGIAERITVVQASARDDDREQVERDRNDDPLPDDGGERVADRAEARTAPDEERDDAGHEEDGDRDTTRESTSADGSGSRGGGLVDLDKPRSDRVPRVPLLHQLAACGAHRRAARLVGEDRDDGFGERVDVAGRERDRRSPASSTSRYPEMSDATTGVAAASGRVNTIPKLSPPSDGATSAFAWSSSAVKRS